MPTAAFSMWYPRYATSPEAPSASLRLNLDIKAQQKYLKIYGYHLSWDSSRRVQECYDRTRDQTAGDADAKHKAASSEMNDVDIGFYVNNQKYRFSTHSPCDDQRVVNMSKKDCVKSHSVSTSDLRGYVDSLRVHGEHFQYRRARMLASKSKGYTKVEYYTCYKIRPGCKATLLVHLYDENGRRLWKVTKKEVHNHGF